MSPLLLHITYICHLSFGSHAYSSPHHVYVDAAIQNHGAMRMGNGMSNGGQSLPRPPSGAQANQFGADALYVGDLQWVSYSKRGPAVGMEDLTWCKTVDNG